MNSCPCFEKTPKNRENIKKNVVHLFNQGIPPPRGLSPLVCREKPQENPRRTQEQSKSRRIQGAEEADSRRRGGRLRVQRSSITVGVEKGGQAEEAFALCQRGYYGFKAQRRGIQGAQEFHRRRRGEGRTSRGGLCSLPARLFFGCLLRCRDD